MNTSNINNWFVCPRANPGAEVRLFLFPYAGGGPAAFNRWTPELPGNVEIWIAHYPGRGSRHNEPPIKQIGMLAESLAQEIRLLLDKPCAFFGHSLGSLAAFELTRQLRQRDLSQPQSLFVSACEAPHLPDPNPPIHSLPDAEFVKSLQQLNGIPSELLDQTEVLQLLLPVLRADFEAIASYRYAGKEPPLDCPIAAFGGSGDPRVSQEGLEGWALHTSAGFAARYFPGDHFYIHTARKAVITAITTELLSSHEKN